MITSETLCGHLERLIGFPTVVGRSNEALISYLAEYLRRHGALVDVLPGPEGDRSNLFASFGPRDRPGVMLSGHLDVVPAQEPGWQADPFKLRRDGQKLIGRGTSDMKGFVAAVLAVVPELAGLAQERPVHIALSYDEEAGCRGVGHMIARLPELCAPPLGCLVGEPTRLRPVLSHKGKAALHLQARGISGHSARPDLGRNAIHLLAPCLAQLVAESERLAQLGPFDENFSPAYHTLQIGVVAGGVAINILPDLAEAKCEARALPGTDPMDLLQPILETVEATPDLSAEILAHYPALPPESGSQFAPRLEKITGHPAEYAVSFGTEAGLFHEAGIPSIICGPGDMARAHRAEEYILPQELHAGAEMILGFVQSL
ncbi:MAG: acetylornithine deacetylase [Mangrovicoccus sp.]